MSRRALALAALVAVLTSCTDLRPIPFDSLPDESPTPAGIGVLAPGRPFDAADILAAMRDSRRPGGVPDELETDAIAAELADLIWTIDGEPWSTMSAGGSCGPQTCTLEIAGGHPDSQGDDLWVFDVEPVTETARVAEADLRSLNPDTLDQLDQMTRSIFPGTQRGLNLTNVRWLPPPEESQFVVSYRYGDEERSACGADITVDAAIRRVVSDLSMDC